MCGIFGFFGEVASEISRKELLRKSVAIRHRGPDSVSILPEKGFIGGVRRLEINGSSGGRQPFSDQKRSVFFNGEIYNYKEISPEAKSDGCVLPGLLDESPFPEVAGADGMFALASFEGKSLLLSRDFAGIKPLYFWISPNKKSIGYSSELKFLLGFDFVGTREDGEAICEFFEKGFLSGRKTGFTGISKVLPGEAIRFSQGKVEYKKMRTYPKGRASDFSDALTISVKEQGRADVPVGLFLSGGLDSSALLFLSEKPEELWTYSAGFSAENLPAKESAELAGARNSQIVIEPEDIFSENAFADCARHTEELSIDPAFIPTKMLSESARTDGLRAVMSGEGADEIFSGYPKYSAIRALSENSFLRALPYRHVPEKLSDFFLPRYGKEGFSRLERMSSAGTPEEMNRIYEEVFEGARPITRKKGKLADAPSPEARAMLDDFKNSLPNKLLLKTDKAGMAESVEIRVPFLSGKILSVFYRKVLSERPLGNKGGLKKILKRALPRKILGQKKEPFFPPFLEKSYLGRLKEAVPEKYSHLLSRRSPNDFARKAYVLCYYSAWKREFGLEE